VNSVAQDSFVTQVTQSLGWDEQFARALDYASASVHSDKSRPRSVDVARRVLELGNDREAVIAALLSDPGLRDVLDDKAIDQEFGHKIAQLTQGVNQLNTLKDGGPTRIDSPEQAEKLRRLLMAVITDVRVMLIKLCYRVERLGLLKHGDYELRRQIARETLDIYAPLANRLGMGLLKWELEDLAFRALEPLV
jgi:GTP pyrophosphokinase